MAISRSKFPANATNPALRTNDPRWPEGPKPGMIVWGEEDGRTVNRIQFQVPAKAEDAELRVTVGQNRQPSFLGLFNMGKRRDQHATVVNPVNMGITSRLTDLYNAVGALNLENDDHEVRMVGSEYIAKPGEMAIRLAGETKYHVFPSTKSLPDAQAVVDTARDAWFATAVGDGGR